MLTVLIPTFARPKTAHFTYTLSKADFINHLYLIGSDHPYDWCSQESGVGLVHLPNKSISTRLVCGARVAATPNVLMMSDDDIIAANPHFLEDLGQNSLLLPQTFYVRKGPRLDRCSRQIFYSMFRLFSDDWLVPSLASNLVIWSALFKQNDVLDIVNFRGFDVSSILTEKLMIVNAYSKGYDLRITPSLKLVRNKTLRSLAQGVRSIKPFCEATLAQQVSSFFDKIAAYCFNSVRKQKILKLKVRFVEVVLRSKGNVLFLNRMLLEMFGISKALKKLSPYLERISSSSPNNFRSTIVNYANAAMDFQEE